MGRTIRQQLGDMGEKLVARLCSCPKCKRNKTLRALPRNFRCADLICDFCGYVAQVKAATVRDISRIPSKVLGAAWAPQIERMNAGVYFPLFLVLAKERERAVYYLPTDLQDPSLFEVRAPLSETARRAGWQGFIYRLDRLRSPPVRLL